MKRIVKRIVIKKKRNGGTCTPFSEGNPSVAGGLSYGTSSNAEGAI